MENLRDESLKAWEANAEFWDNQMGDTSNEFHLKTVRPKVTELLDIKPKDFILDIACGNGNYSAYMADKGAKVVAFDYSKNLIKLAEKRQARFKDNIKFCIADAADEKSLMNLKCEKPFDKAVSNMAVMDIADIRPLFKCVNKMLKENGIFVFATQHPSFVTKTDRYITAHSYYGIAIEGQPQEQRYFHRSMQEIFNIGFDSGFVIDGFAEETFKNREIPEIIIVRMRKVHR